MGHQMNDDIARAWAAHKEDPSDVDKRNFLVEHYMPIVTRLAKKQFSKHAGNRFFELGDFVAFGTFGLLDAIRGFDLSKRVRFEVYCQRRIIGSIIDEIRKIDWLPRLARTQRTRIEKAIDSIKCRTGQAPRDAEIATELGIAQIDLLKMKSESSEPGLCSVDSLNYREGKRASLGIPDPQSEVPARRAKFQSYLGSFAVPLTPKERQLMHLYYYEGVTMRDIGDMFGLSESWVSLTHRKVINRLQENAKANQSLAAAG